MLQATAKLPKHWQAGTLYICSPFCVDASGKSSRQRLTLSTRVA